MRIEGGEKWRGVAQGPELLASSMPERLIDAY